MAIDNVGWTQRPNPVQHDGRRQQRSRPQQKQSKDERAQNPRADKPSGGRPGGIDEVV